MSSKRYQCSSLGAQRREEGLHQAGGSSETLAEEMTFELSLEGWKKFSCVATGGWQEIQERQQAQLKEGPRGRTLDAHQEGQATQDDRSTGRVRGDRRGGRRLGSPRRPKDPFLGRPQLRHGRVRGAGGQAEWMVSGSPGVFPHHQFSLPELSPFLNFYQRIMYPSPCLCSKMIKSVGPGLDFTDQYDVLKIRGTAIMMSTFNFGKKKCTQNLPIYYHHLW